MAKWDSAANNSMQELKDATNASDSQMADLKSTIAAWSDNNPDARQSFPFAPLRLRNHAVSAVTEGGWIRDVSFGDN